MRDSVRITCWVLLCVMLAVAGVAWFGGNGATSALQWLVRIATAIATISIIGLLVWSNFRRENLPDYLRQFDRKPLECEGLCFSIIPEAVDGRGELQVFFQNRYARPCEAQITLKRNHGFAWSTKNLECMSVLLRCDGGAFGVVHVPFAVPRKLQGKKKSFLVEAKTAYPTGRGELLRYRAGRAVSCSSTGSGALFMVALGILGGGVLALAASSRGRYVNLRYPAAVEEQLPDNPQTVTEVLWKPGDEPVESGLSAAA